MGAQVIRLPSSIAQITTQIIIISIRTIYFKYKRLLQFAVTYRLTLFLPN